MIFVKRNDTHPAVAATLVGADGSPLNLTGATARFHLARLSGGPPLVDAPALIVDAMAGKVQYDWQPGDTALAGSFRAEFEITFPGGSVFTVPNDSYIPVVIAEDLD